MREQPTDHVDKTCRQRQSGNCLSKRFVIIPRSMFIGACCHRQMAREDCTCSCGVLWGRTGVCIVYTLEVHVCMFHFVHVYAAHPACLSIEK